MSQELFNDLASVFGDGYIASDVGHHFTCTEADTIARVLKLSGNVEAAETWLEGHAEGDDCGDDHWDTAADRVMVRDEIKDYVAANL